MLCDKCTICASTLSGQNALRCQSRWSVWQSCSSEGFKKYVLATVKSISAWDLVGASCILTVHMKGIYTSDFLVWLCHLVTLGMNCQIPLGRRMMLVTDNLLTFSTMFSLAKLITVFSSR